jgi:DNA-binding transcriptional ArsR family regulator/protein-L-isoaspartate O-methyltransferase
MQGQAIIYNLSLDRDKRIFIINLDLVSRHCGLLGDVTRLRLLALLHSEELTVAELARITRLAQPRVSTHLARLREAGLVADRRDGVSVYYRINHAGENADLIELWSLLRRGLDDALLKADEEHLAEVLALRSNGRNWPDSVAGDMERHYSPGRTWEATARAMVQMIEPGRVLDIASGDGVMGELLANRASRIDCMDLSARVVEAGAERVAHLSNVHFRQGDMHELPFEAASFDTVLLLHALTYSKQPQIALNEAARVLVPGGRLVAATLNRHRYTAEVNAYGHCNSGFGPKQLSEMCQQAGLQVEFCDITSIERKTPNFRIITLLARHP